MSHLLKIFIKVIPARIRTVCESELDASQFGFRHIFGTRETMLSVNILLQKCFDQRKHVHVCFIDYEKAFDRVWHDKLIEIFRKRGVVLLQIIKNLY